MHDARDSGAAARLEHVRRSAYVHRLELGRGGDVAVERCDVADGLAAVDRVRERVELAHVGPLVPHVVPGLAQRPHDVRAHEAAPAAGHVDAHRRH